MEKNAGRKSSPAFGFARREPDVNYLRRLSFAKASARSARSSAAADVVSVVVVSWEAWEAQATTFKDAATSIKAASKVFICLVLDQG